MWSSFAYEESSTSSTLILLSYLFLLNVFGWIAQNLLGARLIGQVLIGIIFGAPLSGWLDEGLEAALVEIGYVGLLLIVFEGGLTTSPKTVLRLLGLSTLVALTGISLPIAFSFLLIPLSGSTPLHSFAAGSALSSTSLGTVLSLLNPESLGFDLRKTKLGIVLLSAAVLDDVVALVLVKILSVIGDGANNGIGQEIGRTIGVTIGLAVIVGLLSKYALSPVYYWVENRKGLWRHRALGGERLLVLFLAVWFIGLIAAAGYAGTSTLFGAYLAGISIARVMEKEERYAQSEEPLVDMTSERRRTSLHNAHALHRAQTLPNFGTSLSTVILSPNMRVTKQQPNCGPSDEQNSESFLNVFATYITPLLDYLLLPIFFGSIGYSIPFVALWRGRIIWRGIIYSILMAIGKLACGIWMLFWPTNASFKTRSKWRGAIVLGLAMIARGEIGLLISQIAYHTDEPLLTEEEFLQVIWAIVLCTIVGPLGLTFAIRRWSKRILEGGWA